MTNALVAVAVGLFLGLLDHDVNDDVDISVVDIGTVLLITGIIITPTLQPRPRQRQ